MKFASTASCPVVSPDPARDKLLGGPRRCRLEGHSSKRGDHLSVKTRHADIEHTRRSACVATCVMCCGQLRWRRADPPSSTTPQGQGFRAWPRPMMIRPTSRQVLRLRAASSLHSFEQGGHGVLGDGLSLGHELGGDRRRRSSMALCRAGPHPRPDMEADRRRSMPGRRRPRSCRRFRRLCRSSRVVTVDRRYSNASGPAGGFFLRQPRNAGRRLADAIAASKDRSFAIMRDGTAMTR